MDAPRERFHDLFGKSLKWYACSEVLLIFALIPVGHPLIARTQSAIPVIDRQIPWIFAVCGVIVNLILIRFCFYPEKWRC